MVFLILILGPTLTFAETLTSQEVQAADQLRTALSHYMQYLERDLVTFHYDDGADKNFEKPSSYQQVVKNTSSAAQFFDVKSRDNIGPDAPLAAPGPGYYVAKDANISRSWGNDDPQLFTVTLKAGARVLDGTTSARELDARSFDEVAKRLHCTLNKSSLRIGTLVSSFRNSESETCRKVIIKAVADLRVQATRYKWWTGTQLKDCQNSDEALNVISADAIQSDQMAYFSNEKVIDPNSMGGLVNHLFDEMTPPKSENPIFPTTKPRALAQFKTTDAAFAGWKKKEIMGCGPSHFSNIVDEDAQKISPGTKR